MPGRPLETDVIIGCIDDISEVGPQIERTEEVAQGEFVTVRGWLLDRAQLAPATEVSIQVGLGPPIQAIVGLERLDVGAGFGERAALAGFIAAIPIVAPLGPRSLMIHARVGGLETHVDVDHALTVIPAPDPFVGLEQDDSGWAFAIDGVFLSDDTGVECGPSDTFLIPPGSPATIRLWVIDADSLEAPLAIVVRFGGRHLRLASTIVREDVAKAFNAPNAAMCGFSVPLLPLPVGTEQADVYAIRGEETYALLTSVRFRDRDSLSSDALAKTASIVGALDEVFVAGASISARVPLNARPGQNIRFRGWAVDETGPRLSGGLEVRIDDALMVEAQTGIPRRDVCEKFGNRGLMPCGFDVGFDMPELLSGAHEVSLRFLSARRDATAEIVRRQITVTRLNEKAR